MKKMFCGLLLVAVLGISGCGSQSGDLTGNGLGSEKPAPVSDTLFGTWEFDYALIDGSRYSAEELKTLDDDEFTDFYVVIKDGGSAYVFVSGDGDVEEWTKDDEHPDRITIGWMEFGYEDAVLSYEAYDGYAVYLKKTSDSQVITGKEPDSDDGESNADEAAEEETATDTVFGTWEFDHANIDGSDYSKEELEAMDDGTLTDFIGLRIIIKEGGGAYIDTDNEQMTASWAENGDGTLSIGNMECKKADSGLLEYNTYADNYIYFVKTSDSQTITGR